jgi:AcrR family transcriptional regulator
MVAPGATSRNGKPGASRGRKATEPSRSAGLPNGKKAVTEVRERILSFAYPLYTARGIREASVEEIQRVSGVSPEEFQREFPCRDTLAMECLERREREWTLGVVEAGARAYASTPEERLLAIFNVSDRWCRPDDREAYASTEVLLEMGRQHRLSEASAEYLLHIRRLVGTLATEAGLRDPDELAMSWHILMAGSIVSAGEGDQQAATRAKEMARDLIARHRPTQPTVADAGSGPLMRNWWGELSNPTRVLVVVNSVVVLGVGVLAALIPLMP